MPIGIVIAVAVVLIVVAAVISHFLTVSNLKNNAESKIGNAEARAREIIDDAVKALEISLTNEDLTYLEEMYVPHPIVGAINENPPQGTVLLDKK